MKVKSDNNTQDRSTFFADTTAPDRICRSFKTRYFEALDKMPEEETTSDVENVHASL
jgi:hypothetical protein